MPNHCENSLVVEINDEELDHLTEEEIREMPEECLKALGEDFFALEEPGRLERLKEEAGRQMERFKKSLRASERIPDRGEDLFTFEELVPLPTEEEAPQSIRPLSLMSIMDTPAIRHWGTKWDAYWVHHNEVTDTKVDLRFDTAWSPPEAYVTTAAEKLNLLRFTLEYVETGMGFFGTLVCFNGEEITNANGDCAFVDPDDHFTQEEVDEMEERGICVHALVEPDTPFAEWCKKTEKFELFRPPKRARPASPPVEPAEV